MRKIIKVLLLTSIFVLSVSVFAKESLGVYVCQYTFDKTNCSVAKTDKWVSDTEETKPCVANTDNGSVCYSATETSYTACDQMGCVGKRAVTYTAVGVNISSYRCETRDCSGGATPTPTPPGGGGDEKKCGDPCRSIPNSNPPDYDCDGDENGSNDIYKGVPLACAPGSPRVCWNSKCADDNPPACAKPGKPTLQKPDNNAKKPDKTPTFNWSNVGKPADCNWVKYHIQVKVGSNTGDNVINKSGLTNSTCTAGSAPCQFVSGKSMVAGKSYFWHVRASTSKGNSDWAGPWKYTVTAGPTVTPGGPTLTPTPTGPAPTDNPKCKCNTNNACTNSCTFDKFASGVNYTDPIKCSLASTFFPTAPTDGNKTDWCRANKRTKGDADGNNVINNADYFYYVAAVNGGKIPVTVNPDFNGDGEIGASDRAIIIKSL